MSKAYQVVTEQGIVIPAALCASAQLGDEVLLEIEPGRIAIRPARLSAYEAQRRAFKYVLFNVGDALTIGAPTLQIINASESWVLSITHQTTGELVGELVLNAESGEVRDWKPVATAIH
jgi:hypothetical protein